MSTKMQRLQSRALSAIGLSDNEASEKYGIGTIREYIERTCENLMKRIFLDVSHPLAIKYARDQQHATRAAHKFEPPIFRTELYNNSIVPLGLRVIRDGVANLYNQSTLCLAASKLKKTTKAKAPKTITGSLKTNNSTSGKAACPNCGGLYEAIRGVKIHLRRCKAAHPASGERQRQNTPNGIPTTT